MLKQPASRNQRSRGFKVKHVLQICVLLAISIWLLNHFRHSYEKNVHQNGAGGISENVETEHEIKLGRKDLHPREEETALDVKSYGNKVELEEEMEEIKPEENEDEGRGGGDDEIDGRDQERAEEEGSEEVEDLIDVDDREREEGNEEQETEEKGNQLKVTTSLGDQVQTERERNLQEAREEHYKGDDAASSAVQNTGSVTNEFAVGARRKVQEKEIDNAEGEEFPDKIKRLLFKKLTVATEDTDHGKHMRDEEKGVELNFPNSDVTETVANEKPEVKFNSRLLMPAENSRILNETHSMPESIDDPNITAARSSERTVKKSESRFSLTDYTETEYLDALDADFGVSTLSESSVPPQI